MPPPRRRIIGVTGTIAAGKGEVVQWFAAHGYTAISLSDLLRERAAAAGQPPTRDVLTRLGNALRRERGGGGLAALALERVTGERVVVDSVRHPAEVDTLRAAGDCALVAADAPIDLRFARARARGRVGDGETLETFAAREARERSDDPERQQLHRCLALADITVWNDGDLDQFYRRIAEACGHLLDD